jgi:NAD(P)-dependent dehydrogenase (short-subunit alcohol dehydrogenase family)
MALTAIVTGASRGIGAETARELAGAGMNVTLAARSQDQLDALHEELSAAGGSVHTVVADMQRPPDLERIVDETVERFGSVDALVNNAAYFPDARLIADAQPDVWQMTMEVNVRAPLLLSRHVYPHMKRAGGGAVVNVVSTTGVKAEIGLGLYGMSKAALILLTRSCAKEWLRDRIRVNAVMPSTTDTEMAEPIEAYLRSKGLPPTPLGDLIQPREVACLINFLVDDRGRHITGSVVDIDAGHTL